MQVFRTHVYDPKSNTACNAALSNILDTIWLVPSRSRILVGHAQLFRTFLKFPTTAGQSPFSSVKTRPEYLNKVTVSNGLP